MTIMSRATGNALVRRRGGERKAFNAYFRASAQLTRAARRLHLARQNDLDDLLTATEHYHLRLAEADRLREKWLATRV